jgi:hypothetical protein
MFKRGFDVRYRSFYLLSMAEVRQAPVGKVIGIDGRNAGVMLKTIDRAHAPLAGHANGSQTIKNDKERTRESRHWG